MPTITFSAFGKMGRLGNQLLQWLAMKGIAESNACEFVIPVGSFNKYKHAFIDPPIEKSLTNTWAVKEKHYHYDDSLMGGVLVDGADISGWLQSPKYYKPHHVPKFTEEFKKEVRSKFQVYNKPTIAISIRRGDFVNNWRYANLQITYYISALLSLGYKDKNIVFFSDDLQYCKLHFECLPNAFFADDLSDIEQLCSMSMCDEFIISNSTFSYCGALLSGKPTVLRPRWIFSEKYRADHSEKDYWPEGWKIHDDKRIDLKDVTFTIPVFFDHIDRKQNINLSLCLLQRHFESNYIIGEQGSKEFGYMSAFAKYQWFNLPYFHRTKMLNDMIRQAETPIIVNWDADNLVPPMQLYLAVEEVRAGAHMVYPFDGRVARMSRTEWFKRMEKDLDIGIVGDTKFTGRFGKDQPVSSVGHAIVMNKKQFIAAGMENEYFISYGPEDCERYDRWVKLEHDVRRVKGVMYHMDHFTGINSGVRNPYFKKNREELERERLMTVDEMRAYIDEFPWRHKYTEVYYENISDSAKISAEIVYKALEEVIKINTVIDIGCGAGQWKHGEYTGVDHGVTGTDFNYIDHDLTKLFKHDKRYDLCLCLEVAEHIPKEHAAELVDLLCGLSPYVLFSAAIPFQGGTGHENEQWQSYWARLFARFGYVPFKEDIRMKVWNNDQVDVWYRQNMVLYSRKMPAGNYPLDLVHPRMWMNHKSIKQEWWVESNEKLQPMAL